MCSRLNQNLVVLVYEERCMETWSMQRKPLGSKERTIKTNCFSTHIWHLRLDLSPGHIGGRHLTHHYACAIRASSISNTRRVCFHKTKLVLRFLLLWWDLHSLQWSKVKKNEMKTRHPWITPVYRFFFWRINKNFGNIKIWYPPSFA